MSSNKRKAPGQFLCLDSSCTRVEERVYPRCGCGQRLAKRCAKCGETFSATNFGKHESRCSPPPPPPASPVLTRPPLVSRGRRSFAFVWVLRPASYDNCVALPYDLRVPAGLKSRLRTEGDGDPCLEEYDLMGAFMEQLGHTVTYVLPEALEAAFQNPDGAAAKEIMGGSGGGGGARFLFDGEWPYAMSEDPAKFQGRLADLQALGSRVVCIPRPDDLLLAAHKSIYHAALRDSGVPIIRSIYLTTWSDDATLGAAVDSLLAPAAPAAADDAAFTLVLKRGLSQCGHHFHLLRGTPAEIRRAAGRTLRGKEGRSPTRWLLQQFVPEFTTEPELKLFFDWRGELVAAFAQRWKTESKLPEGGGGRGGGGGGVTSEQICREAQEEWNELGMPEATKVALMARGAILARAPSLRSLLRIDLIRTAEFGFVVNEVEHLGNAWLFSQHSGLSHRLVKHWAISLDAYLQSAP